MDKTLCFFLRRPKDSSTPFVLSSPAFTDRDRGLKLLEQVRAQHPEFDFAVFQTTAIPGAKAVGDRMGDDKFIATIGAEIAAKAAATP